MRVPLVAIITVTTLAGATPAHAEADAPSPAAATALSVAGTVVPAGLVALGLTDAGPDALIAVGGLAFLVTPTLGHWYAGARRSTGMRLRGIGVLTTALGGMAYGLAMAGCGESTGCDVATGAAEGLLLAGAGTIVVGAIVDVVTAGAVARTHAGGVQVTPVLTPQAGAGLALAGAF